MNGKPTYALASRHRSAHTRAPNAVEPPNPRTNAAQRCRSRYSEARFARRPRPARTQKPIQIGLQRGVLPMTVLQLPPSWLSGLTSAAVVLLKYAGRVQPMPSAKLSAATGDQPAVVDSMAPSRTSLCNRGLVPGPFPYAVVLMAPVERFSSADTSCSHGSARHTHTHVRTIEHSVAQCTPVHSPGPPGGAHTRMPPSTINHQRNRHDCGR